MQALGWTIFGTDGIGKWDLAVNVKYMIRAFHSATFRGMCFHRECNLYTTLNGSKNICMVGSRSLCEVCANSWRCKFATGFVQQRDELIITVFWEQTDVEEMTFPKCR